MPGDVITDLRTAVDAAARTIDGRGSQIKERELEIALKSALWAAGRKPRSQFAIQIEDAWSGRIGGVDLAFASDESTILVELKWDSATLAACAWDQVKLAAALHSGEGSRAFLIGGSPLSSDLRGDELLDDAEVEPAALRNRYAADFDYWKKDVKNHPRLAPARWRTRRLHEASLEYQEEPWRICLAELELIRFELVPFGETNAR